MEDLIICPHCGHELNETVPLALVGSIQLKCPTCGMFYLFQREGDEDILEQEIETYLSRGPFQRKFVLSRDDRPHPVSSISDRYTYLLLCLIGPLIIFGIMWFIPFLIWILITP